MENNESLLYKIAFNARKNIRYYSTMYKLSAFTFKLFWIFELIICATCLVLGLLQLDNVLFLPMILVFVIAPIIGLVFWGNRCKQHQILYLLWSSLHREIKEEQFCGVVTDCSVRLFVVKSEIYHSLDVDQDKKLWDICHNEEMMATYGTLNPEIEK